MGFLDIFRISEIKKENEELNGKVQNMEKILEETKSLTIAEINDYIAKKEKEKKEINVEVIKYNNIDSIENKIATSFRILNQAFKPNLVSIREEFLNLKYQELYLGYEFERKKAEEKD